MIHDILKLIQHKTISHINLFLYSVMYWKVYFQIWTSHLSMDTVFQFDKNVVTSWIYFCPMFNFLWDRRSWNFNTIFSEKNYHIGQSCMHVHPNYFVTSIKFHNMWEKPQASQTTRNSWVVAKSSHIYTGFWNFQCGRSLKNIRFILLQY